LESSSLNWAQTVLSFFDSENSCSVPPDPDHQKLISLLSVFFETARDRKILIQATKTTIQKMLK